MGFPYITILCEDPRDIFYEEWVDWCDFNAPDGDDDDSDYEDPRNEFETVDGMPV